MLEGLLRTLQRQRTDGLFTYSILVVDNDNDQSALAVVESVRAEGGRPIAYCVAAEKNVAVARNAAVQNACGDFIAFIDDDETPSDRWLLNLVETQVAYGSDGVLGPVKPVFDVAPPDWIVKARLFERPSYPTGTVLPWNHTRTGNVLLRRAIFDDRANLFNPAFKHSEDRDFFRRMIAKGLVFVWCDEAPVYETETSDRFRRSYFLKRALVRGNAAMRHYRFSKTAIARSLVAVVVYLAALPVLIFGGQHLFMRYLIKLCDHIGALLAVAKVDLVNHFGGA
jgi:glycosyltransferase involved in cell wall biosynthesis